MTFRLMDGIAGFLTATIVVSGIGWQQKAQAAVEINGASPTKTITKTAQTSENWEYKTVTDKMTGKPIKTANLTSESSLSLKFPYQGTNYAWLLIRRDGGNDGAMFIIQKGQTMCKSYADGCIVMVKFDDAQPMSFTGTNPSDGSSTHVFLKPASKFIAAAKKAKKITVAITIYQNGTQVIDFASSSPLQWP